MTVRRSNRGSVVVVLVALVAGGWYFVSRGVANRSSLQLAAAENKAASDTIAKYEAARRDGHKTDICLSAGLVAAQYLKARDETRYAAWKKAEDSDCKTIGFPF